MARTSGRRGQSGDGGVQWFRALVLIIVLVAIGAVILAKTSNGTATRTASSTAHPKATTTVTTLPPSTTSTTLLPSGQVKVQVLNGLRTGSLSSQWVAKLKSQFGYQTGPPDDATATVTTSVIYVLTPGYQPEADQLAARVGLTPASVDPTVPAPASAPIPVAERTSANLVLIVGQDLAGTG